MRLIDGKENLILPTLEALRRARERGLDLVEVAGRISPPVVKILDFRKFLFEQKKKRQLLRRTKSSAVKELRFGPRIGEHDLGLRIKKAEGFLREGSPVKLTVHFRGREIAHPEIGRIKLERVIKELGKEGKQEGELKKMGRFLIARVTPR